MIEKLLVRLIGDGSSYRAMMKSAVLQTDRFERTIKNANARINAMGKSITRIGRKLSLGITAPLLGMGGVAVNEFAKFDQAMTESTSIMNVTAKQTKQMRDLALSLSGLVVQSPKELGESYFFLASAGLDAERSMAALPKVAAFATAGAFDMALATDLLTDAQTALGLGGDTAAESLKNLVKISDIFVAANQSANTSVQQVAEAMTSDAGTAARQMGQEIESVVAVLEAYASAGKKGAEAGNLYGRAVRLLTGAARKNAKEFKKLDIKVVDPLTGGFRDLIDIVKDMENAFEGMTKPQIAAKLSLLGFKDLAQKSLTPLIGLSGAMNEYKEKLLKAGSATQIVADKQMKSFTNQMRLLKNQATVAAIEIGEVLAPFVLALSEALKVGISKFRELDDSTKLTIVGAVAVAAALGPVLIVLGALTAAVTTLTSVGLVPVMAAMKLLSFIGFRLVAVAFIPLKAITILFTGSVIKLITLALFPLKIALGFVFTGLISLLAPIGAIISSFLAFIGPVAVVIGGVIAIVAVIGLMATKWEWAGGIIKAVFETIVDLAAFASRVIFRVMTATAGFLVGLWDKFWTVDWIDTIIRGFEIAGKLLERFAKFAFRKFKAVFTGSETGTFDEFLKSVKGDFAAGKSNINLLETVSNIIGEEVAVLKEKESIKRAVGKGRELLVTGKEFVQGKVDKLPLNNLINLKDQVLSSNLMKKMQVDIGKLVSLQERELDKESVELSGLGI